MKIIDVVAGSDEWRAVRLGIPTASQFHKIITPARAQFSKQARGYAIYLLAEKLLHRSLDPVETTEWMERGKETEPEAIRAYEFQTETETKPVGFITTDDGRAGCTPDRLIIGRNGALETKVPAPHTHLAYLLDGFGDDYRAQVQGQMLIGEFEFADRFSYSEEMPPVHLRTYRDDAYIGLLRSALGQFLDMFDGLEAKARELGAFATHARLITPREEAVIEAVRRESLREPLNDFGMQADDWISLYEELVVMVRAAESIPALEEISESRKLADLRTSRKELAQAVDNLVMKRGAQILSEAR